MKRIIYLLIAFSFIIFMGCKKEQPVKQPVTEQVKEAAAQPETRVSEAAKQFIPEEYAYDSKGRRDPFVSLIIATKQKPLKKKGASPVESYDIDEIRLLAIAWDKNKYYALIQLPDKKAYTITEGMTLGLMGGKVEKITKDTLLLREYVKDYRGDIKARDSILKLHKGEEE
jgi:Tfp pilus assembly protein PilP